MLTRTIFTTRPALFAMLLTLFLSFSLPTYALAKEAIVIGLLPEMNVFKQMKRFTPLASYLGQRLGTKVQLTMLSRYGNIVKRLDEQQVDAAFLGSFTGTLCIIQLDVEPLARPVNLDGTSTYFGYIFVRKDSGIRTVADMRGKTMAFVERATTAGYVFPLAYFKRYGVEDFASFFKKYYFTGSHDAAINAVLNGEADVGAAKNTIFELLQETNPRVRNELLILAESPKVPSNGLCVRHDMDQELKDNLKELLLNLDKDPAGSAVLEKLRAKRFVATHRDDYKPVMDLAAEAGIDLQSYQYVNQ